MEASRIFTKGNVCCKFRYLVSRLDSDRFLLLEMRVQMDEEEIADVVKAESVDLQSSIS